MSDNHFHPWIEKNLQHVSNFFKNKPVKRMNKFVTLLTKGKWLRMNGKMMTPT